MALCMRQLESSSDGSDGGSYILIGSDHSLYTGKLRAYLNYKGIRFEQLTASRQTYKQVILPRTGVAFIPVLVCPDRSTVLQDTHAIMQHLEHQHPAWPILPHTPRQSLASQLLELYGDEGLLLPAMHYRWSFRQQQELLLFQFGSTSAPAASYQQHLDIGRQVSAHFSGMLGALGINPHSAPVIERRFAWQLAVLQQHLQQQPFLLSTAAPCSGEFGCMGPLFAHLYHDPVPACIIKCRAPLVAAWIEQLCGIAGTSTRAGCRQILGLHPEDPQQPARGVLKVQRSGSQAPSPQQQQQQQQQQELPVAGRAGQPEGTTFNSNSGCEGGSGSGSGSGSGLFLPNDAVPASLLPLLHHLFQEQMPVINSTLRLLRTWIDKQQQQQQQEEPANSSSNSSRPPASRVAAGGWLVVPRSLGRHCFTLQDPVTGQPVYQGQRSVGSYVAWRAALIAEWFQALERADQQAVMQLLQEVSSAGPGSSWYAAAAAATAAAWTPAKTGAATAAAGGGNTATAAAGVADDAAAGTADKGSSSSCGVAGNHVDAAAAFAEMLRLVAACGQIGRVNNRVAVRQGTAAGAVSNVASSKL